ncbi:MAG: phosphoglycerate kinase [bacterium]|nr:phosphoglycerate kinase [bacterium]
MRSSGHHQRGGDSVDGNVAAIRCRRLSFAYWWRHRHQRRRPEIGGTEVRITSLDDVEVRGRTVLLRPDINSPIDRATGKIADENRLDKSLPTIADLADSGARLVIIAHQGDTLDYHNLVSMDEHAEKLSTKLNRPVKFIDDVAGPAARTAIGDLQDGEILLLDNIRILTEEVSTFESAVKLTPQEMTGTYLVRKLAPLVDLYVNDAFAAAHRNAPSLVGFQELLPSAGGRLLVDEVNTLSSVADDPMRPCLFVLGGLKISDAFAMMAKVLRDGTADTIVTSGVTANVMLWAKGVDIGDPSKTFITDRSLNSFLPQAAKWQGEFGDRIQVPTDLAVAAPDGSRVELQVGDLPTDQLIIDIGSDTIARYRTLIEDAATIFVNGPAGVYESEAGEPGTRAMWEAVAAASGNSVIGGGDTVASARRFVDLDDIGFVSTGGGALVRFLSGQSLPMLEAMQRAAARKANTG